MASVSSAWQHGVCMCLEDAVSGVLKNANGLLLFHSQVRFEPTGCIQGPGGLEGD